MGNLKVFIANDDLKIIDSIMSIFTDYEGFEIIGTSQDGMEACQKMMELKPDLAFVGNQMKNLNGPEIMEKVNPFSLKARTVFVLISDKKIFLQYDFLQKYRNIAILYTPVERRELIDVKNEFLEYRKRMIECILNENYIRRENALKDYYYTRHIDYSKYLNEKDVELLHKLEIDIDLNKKYTEEEQEIIEDALIEFWDGGSDIFGDSLLPDRKLELTGVSREEYNRLYDIIYSVETMYT